MSVLALLVCLFALCTVPASALEYTIEAPAGAEFAQPTSLEPVITADRGEQSNMDLSKNNPIVAPTFGSNTSYLPDSGEPLYPFLGANAVPQTAPNAAVIPLPNIPGASSASNAGNSGVVAEPISPSYGYTEVTQDMYYSGGYLGRVKIPALGVNVKVYEGTDSKTLAKGAGHFEDTSIWEGNICIAGHNRGTNCYFGEIHTLKSGDTITFTTKAGTRTYSVVSVSKVKETDTSTLSRTVENRITLFTCVRNQSAYRWCVRAVEVK